MAEEIKLDIPPLFQHLCPHVFRVHIPGFVATVIDSGNTWVELNTAMQGVNVKFGVSTDMPVRLYPGSQIHFDHLGNFLATPSLARSKKAKKLPKVPTKIPRSSLTRENKLVRPGGRLPF